MTRRKRRKFPSTTTENGVSYAKEHHLLLTGYAYEEGLNEMALKNQADYITMITIPCSVSDLTEKRLCFPEK